MIYVKIGASTLSGFKDDIETNLEYFEGLGLDYAEILHQYPNQEENKTNGKFGA